MTLKVVRDHTVDFPTQNNKMEPSIVLMSRQRTKDRSKITTILDADLYKLSVSISYDGGFMYDGAITCGISSTDTTQHRLFAFDVSIEDECPVEPSILDIDEVAELARSYMRTKGVDLPAEKYNTFLVSPLQKDVSKKGAANAKYRAIVTAPNHEVFTPGLSASNPSSNQRMPHIFFSKPVETKSPMENKRGSSAAVNTSTIHDALKSLKRYLRVTFSTKSKQLPHYAALFVYANADALENFVDLIGDIALKDQKLLNEVSGNFRLYPTFKVVAANSDCIFTVYR